MLMVKLMIANVIGILLSLRSHENSIFNKESLCHYLPDFIILSMNTSLYGSGQTSERGVMMWQSEASLLK